MTKKKQIRTWEWQDWPKETRPHYIRLFSLQERLRAHLKMAHQLALKNYQSKHSGGNPRKTNPILLANRQDDYLKKYREDQWPDIKHYLTHMRQEIKEIKKSYKGGSPPKWYQVIIGSSKTKKKVKKFVGVENLTEQIWEKMELIQVHLILTLRDNNQAIKESNQAIIDETVEVLETAWSIREELLFFRPDQTTPGRDKDQFEAILESPHRGQPDQEQPFMDLSTIWQSQQHKKTRG